MLTEEIAPLCRDRRIPLLTDCAHSRRGHLPLTITLSIVRIVTTSQITSETHKSAGATKPDSRSAWYRNPLVVTLLLLAFTLVTYAPSLRDGFVNYDDPAYVTHNPHVLQGVSPANILWAFQSSSEANWHPLTWISHMVDVQIYGLNSAGHHFTSLLLHLLNVALVLYLLRAATGSLWRSAAVAALFALHPLNVESIAWVSERKTVLSVFFLLLTLLAYGWYVKKPGVLRYLAIAFFFTLGLLSKPLVITLPFALLLLDYWPLRRLPDPFETKGGEKFTGILAKLALEKAPLFLFVVLSSWITVLAQRQAGALAHDGALPFLWRLKNAAWSYVAYLGKAIWPANLAVFYPHPEASLSLAKVAIALALLVALTGVTVRFREHRYLLAGWLWYLGTMLPMIGIVQVGRQAMADRYAYLPFLGLFVAIVWLAGDMAPRAKISPSMIAASGMAVLVVLASVTFLQLSYWMNSYTLFNHAVQVTRNNYVAENDLGEALVGMGKPELALSHFVAATQDAPNFSTGHYNLAVQLQKQNRLEEARREYLMDLQYVGDPVEAAQAHNNLGVLYLTQGKSEDAVSELNVALQIDPAKQNSYLSRGIAEYKSGKFAPAETDFSHATSLSPSPQASFWLGRVRETRGDFAGATSAYRQAVQIAPDMAEATQRLNALENKSVVPQ